MKRKNNLKEKNKVIFASAGSGKTTLLVKSAILLTGRKVLITTYTQANEAEIRKKIIEINKCIPANITIQTWFSFLLRHGVRPYQGILLDKKVKGLLLVNEPSGVKYKLYNGQPVYYGENDELERHYFSKDQKIFSDKISKFVVKANKESRGKVIGRLSDIYSDIFIDEFQDLAGHDLELLKLLFKSTSNILLVGDPRQATYSTNNSTKNKKYEKAAIKEFFTDHSNIVIIDDSSLVTNYRCNPIICDLSNRLFPELQGTTSGNVSTTGHDGVFFVKEADVASYLEKFRPMQLRDSRRTEVHEGFEVMNIGDSKGLSFDRVLIYPTQPFVKWLKNNASELKGVSRSKLYVALTRARYSVAIVYDYNPQTTLSGIENYVLLPE